MLDLLKLAPSTKMNGEKADALGMITPYNISEDMVSLVKTHIENNKTKEIWEYTFIDIACKSGNFLRAVYVWLFNHNDMINKFSDDTERADWIATKQIYGICFRETDMLIANRNTFGKVRFDSNIKTINKWQDIIKSNNFKMIVDTLKETFGIMKFDAVIGNPPYNNDIYLDFVTLGHKLIKDSNTHTHTHTLIV